MPAKPNARNWNDVQTAIATVAIVTTLGLWNLFATPSKTEAAQADEPVIPPTEPTEPPVTEVPAAVMPQVKIMFAQIAPQPQTTVAQQPQQQKKKNNNNQNTKKKNGGGSVTKTKTS